MSYFSSESLLAAFSAISKANFLLASLSFSSCSSFSCLADFLSSTTPLLTSEAGISAGLSSGLTAFLPSAVSFALAASFASSIYLSASLKFFLASLTFFSASALDSASSFAFF